MDSGIKKWLYKTGAEMRNPGLFSRVDELMASDFWTRTQYLELQQEKLRKLLRWHKIHTPFYTAQIKDSENPFEQLKYLPILTKKDLLANIKALTPINVHEKSFLAETSGSTGDPFKFLKNVSWDTANRASFLRGYRWYNVEPWQRNGYFWGYNLSTKEKLKTSYLDFLQNRFRVFSYSRDELKVFLKRMKNACYIHGYSSMIFEVAQIADELGFKPYDFPHLRMVKGTSEKIYPFYHEPVQRVFGHKIISEYGSAEGGIHAFECPHGSMHINEENILIEEVDGEAVITNLNALSLPIIRYKIGDAIKLEENITCVCGRKSRMITEVTGRVGKKILGKQGSYPSLTLYYVFKNISLNHGVDIQYQGFQSEKGKLDLRIVRSLTPNERKWILQQTDDYFGTDLDVNLLEDYRIHDKKGKLKDFISSIALS